MPDLTEAFDILLLPCRDNASADHWQSHWQAHFPAMTRVVQDNWTSPKFDDWSARLDEYLARTTRPVILVGHSLGTSLIMKWATRPTHPIAGAFLVAPSDRGPADIWTEAATSGFAPMEVTPFPFPSMILASHNDPYVAFDRAQLFARSWGSDLIDMGQSGHMGNSDALGLWPQGLFHFATFVAGLAAARGTAM